MSEEELEAIEDIKEMLELNEDECLITTDYDFKCLEILLNLIEKQQKEIVELNNVIKNKNKEIKEYNYYKAEYERLEDIEEKYDKALKEIEALKHLKGFIRIDNNGKMELLKLTDYISKDKIKAKIEELEEELSATDKDSLLVIHKLESEIKVLQELLGEEV